MNPQQRHWIEKTQVQVVCVLALAAVYFLAAPALKPWDEGGAIAFAFAGEYGRLILLGAIVAALAGASTLLTLQARPEGALLATLVGLAGLSFRSGLMRTVLWRSPEHFRPVYNSMLLEMLLLLVMLIEAAVIVWLLRAAVRLLRPSWLWQEEPHDERGRLLEQSAGEWQELAHGLAKSGHGWLILPACVALELCIAMLLLVCMFRTPDRGQIAFALAASFMLAALATHQLLPVRVALPFWLAPVLLALVVYLFAPDSFPPGTGPGWRQVEMVARAMPMRAALPIDWLSLGAGGAVAGYWLSRRIHQTRLHPIEE